MIAVLGDGAYMFGNPTPAHYVAQANRLPFLTVILNNAVWGAVHRSTTTLYPGGYAARDNQTPLTFMEPSPRLREGGRGERRLRRAGRAPRQAARRARGAPSRRSRSKAAKRCSMCGSSAARSAPS
ncbi:MAG: thiamine pyrophosphate-dependent enzyme [Pseudomonadota bacterium]